jgi:hypothetical protein
MTEAEKAEVINFASAWVDHRVGQSKKNSINSNGSLLPPEFFWSHDAA